MAMVDAAGTSLFTEAVAAGLRCIRKQIPYGRWAEMSF